MRAGHKASLHAAQLGPCRPTTSSPSPTDSPRQDDDVEQEGLHTLNGLTDKSKLINHSVPRIAAGEAVMLATLLVPVILHL